MRFSLLSPRGWCAVLRPLSSPLLLLFVPPFCSLLIPHNYYCFSPLCFCVLLYFLDFFYILFYIVFIFLFRLSHQISVCQEMLSELRSAVSCKKTSRSRHRRRPPRHLHGRTLLSLSRPPRATRETRLCNGRLYQTHQHPPAPPHPPPAPGAQRLQEDAPSSSGRGGCAHFRICQECRRIQTLRGPPPLPRPPQSPKPPPPPAPEDLTPLTHHRRLADPLDASAPE